MDTEYLKKNIGPILVKCCAEVVERRPQDPIEYISQYLYKYIANEKANQEVSNKLYNMTAIS